MRKVLRLAHLYPRLMNIYGDRGNILCLRRRCEARDIELAVEDLVLGDPLDPAAYDLIFMGGGQDREQRRIAEDLALRLKYAGLEGPAAVEHDVETALDRALRETPVGGLLYVVPTYTAMLRVRELLARRGRRAHYWEEP